MNFISHYGGIFGPKLGKLNGRCILLEGGDYTKSEKSNL